jgi:hypothetical protein
LRASPKNYPHEIPWFRNIRYVDIGERFFKQDIFTPVAYPYLFLPDLYISADTPFMSVYADLLGLCGRSD